MVRKRFKPEQIVAILRGVEPAVGVGPGISFFDEVIRIDFATGLNRNGTFRFSFSTSGLF